MKFGQQLRNSTFKRLQAALEQDNSIVLGPEELKEAVGFTEAYLEMLGLTKADLKRLETCGFAKRGYLPRMTRRGKNTGHQVRWVLLAQAPEGVAT